MKKTLLFITSFWIISILSWCNLNYPKNNLDFSWSINDSTVNQENGQNKKPPQESIDACKNKKSNETCSFTAPFGSIEGVCTDDNGVLSCLPSQQEKKNWSGMFNNPNTINNNSKNFNTDFIKRKFLDVGYANDSSTQKLDIYLPEEGDGPFPVIVAIHGGAFKMGSKNGWDLTSMFKSIEKWYAVVSVDYRLSDEAIFPAAIDDIQKAIVFIKENAKKYSLDSKKIATWWDSAWWNLASLAGTMGEKSKNTNVQAVIDWFGPIYFSKMDEQFTALWVTPAMWKTNSQTSPESQYLGKTVWTQEAEFLVKKASPETYITSDDPAFFIQHWTADRNIPITQSENFAKSLENVIWKEKVTFIKLDWASHGWNQFESESNLEKIFNFLDKYLK